MYKEVYGWKSLVFSSLAVYVNITDWSWARIAYSHLGHSCKCKGETEMHHAW